METAIDLSPFLLLHRERLAALKATERRSAYKRINWGDRLIVLTGARGVGKTTLILQYVREQFKEKEGALMVSGDSILLHAPGLFELAWAFKRMGGSLLVVDEAHKYPNWQQEVKNIYDNLPTLRVIVSGSSSLDILRGQYDLSRRAVPYRLQGLSFREYLALSAGKNGFSAERMTPLSLTEILDHPGEVASGITRKCEEEKLAILKLFHGYMGHGCYPYFLEGEQSYMLRMENALSKVLREDIPSSTPLGADAVPTLQKLVAIIGGSAPFTPNISNIASDLGVAKETVYGYMEALERAGVLLFLRRGASASAHARKPEKIYLENPNLIRLFGAANADTLGAMRETFVVNQLREQHNIRAAPQGDFLVDDRFLLEIGGKNKKRKQIAGNTNAFVLRDDIEHGAPGVVPLWLLGFLY